MWSKEDIKFVAGTSAMIAGITLGIGYGSDAIKERHECLESPACTAQMKQELKEESEKTRQAVDKALNGWGKFFVR